MQEYFVWPTVESSLRLEPRDKKLSSYEYGLKMDEELGSTVVRCVLLALFAGFQLYDAIG